VTALVELNLGRRDVAEGLVATSVRHWDGTADCTQAVLGGITLATIHVQAGEPRGLELAHRAITAVDELRSVRARDRLVPLVAALETRPGRTSAISTQAAGAVKETFTAPELAWGSGGWSALSGSVNDRRNSRSASNSNASAS
jgi:hypothetical protein